MSDDKEFPDELTESMHATFTVSDEDDRKHRVWAAIRMAIDDPDEYLLEDALALQQVTGEDFDRHVESFIALFTE